MDETSAPNGRGIYVVYKAAVERYFAGELDVEFPLNTYRPPGLNIRRAPPALQAA